MALTVLFYIFVVYFEVYLIVHSYFLSFQILCLYHTADRAVVRSLGTRTIEMAAKVLYFTGDIWFYNTTCGPKCEKFRI